MNCLPPTLISLFGQQVISCSPIGIINQVDVSRPPIVLHSNRRFPEHGANLGNSYLTFDLVSNSLQQDDAYAPLLLAYAEALVQRTLYF